MTTGPGHGKDTALSFDDSGGTLRDVGPYIRDITFSQNGQVIDVTGMGETAWRKFIAGLKGATVTISGVLNDTALTGTVAVFLGAQGSTRSIQYGPLGNDTGKVKLSAEVIVESVEVQSGVEAEATFSASGTITDSVTQGTY